MTGRPTYEDLQKKVIKLEKEALRLKKTEEELQRTSQKLNERLKELHCLYGISHLVERPGISLRQILMGTVEFIPPAWRYPEITHARITLDGEEFRTPGFRATPWRQASNIVVWGEQAGALEVFYAEKRAMAYEGPFLEEERELLDAITERLGRIVERKRAEKNLQKAHDDLETRVAERTDALRRVSSRLLNAHEEERRRIALELHDGIGQALGAIKFSLESAVQQMHDGTQSSPTELLEPVVAMLGEAVEEVRRLQRNLRPSVLDDLGILATLSWFSREFESVYPGIAIERKIHIDEEAVPESIKIVIFRIIQEAFNNISKHSQADSATLSLKAGDGGILLAIRDNGVGFDVASNGFKEHAGRGLGLTGMKERTELSGGSFVVESTPGVGTSICASWEVKQAN